MAADILWTGPDEPVATLVLAHGAGAAMDSVGMNQLADVLASRGIRTARFEFGYMAARRQGSRPFPPKAETLVGEYLAAVEQVTAELGGTPFIGGRSMGGRVATLLADELAPPGVVCFGYPFHPPAKPEQLRTAHLEHLRTPVLICQGTRDEFGTRDEVVAYTLSPAIEIEWIEGATHGLSTKAALATAADACKEFLTRGK